MSSTSWSWFHDGLETVYKFDASRFDIASMLSCFESVFDFKPVNNFQWSVHGSKALIDLGSTLRKHLANTYVCCMDDGTPTLIMDALLLMAPIIP